MADQTDNQTTLGALLEEKDRRIQELERRLVEAENNLQALISQQVDAVLTSANTIPLLLSQAQQALQRSHEQLELRVAERTAELKRANSALARELEERKQAEDRFHSVWEIALNGLVLSDPQGVVLAANPAYCDLYGYSSTEMVGQDFAIIFPEAEREQARLSYQKAFNDPTPPPTYETTIRRKDDQLRVVEARATFLVQDGQRKAMLSIIRDITERKQMEEALRASEEKFRGAFENAVIGFAMTTSDGRFVDANPAYLALTGYSIEELKTFAFNQLIHPADRADNMAQNRRMTAGEIDSFVIENRYIRKDGQVVWVRKSVSQTRSPEGVPQWNIALVEDITERKRAEQALRNSEDKFATAFRSSPVALGITRQSDGQYIDVNESLCQLIGYSREEMIGRKTADLGIYKDMEERNEFLQRLKERGSLRNVERTIRNKTGSPITALLSFDPIEVDGEACILATMMDLTERKQAVQALERAHNDLVNERNRLMAVMEALPVGLAIYDDKGGVIQANQGFEAVWGSPRPPANSIADYDLYKAWWVETGQRVQAEEWASARAALHGETVTGQFIQIQRFDGTLGFVLNSGAPVRDAQGRVVGATVAIMDITDRVRAERALKESEDRFRVALASVPLLVYTCDRDQRYTWVYNPLQGFHAEAVLGKRDDELLPPDDAADLISAKQMALDTGQGYVTEVKVPGNGQVNYYILTTEPIKDARGQVTGLTCSAIDITVQKQLEIEQEENEMRVEVQRRLMEYREKERQEIARDLHDGPIQLLSGTIFHLQVAKEAAQEPLIKLELEEATLNLKGAVRELRDTMNELRPPAIIRFGLAKSARMYAEDFREKHPELKLNLHMFDDGDLLPEPIRLALFRILQESLTNIAKHANASQVRIRLLKKGGEVHLQIHDNGAGFEVPTDLILQTQRGHYGMAGMKERAEAVGGRFSVTSEPGKGTTSLVVVPIPVIK